jgi:hypothetical protein
VKIKRDTTTGYYYSGVNRGRKTFLEGRHSAHFTVTAGTSFIVSFACAYVVQLRIGTKRKRKHNYAYACLYA